MNIFYVIPLSLSGICAYTDLKGNLILNKITIPMSLLGLIYSALTGRTAVSLIGLAIGFGILLAGVLRGGAGAGDAKLAGALGAWLGYGILPAIFIACVIGLGWGIIRLHGHGLLKTRMKLFFKGIYYWLVYGMQGVLPMSKLPDDEKAPLPVEAIPFGVCLAAGAWIVWTIIIFQGAGVRIVW